MTDDDIHKKINQLISDVANLRQDLDKLGNMCATQAERFSEVIDAQTDTFARLKNIERAVFPNLMSDLAQVQKAIGPYDVTSPNPLDHRKR